ncbi:MAG: AraC family transcriptional regulator [Flavobacteriaceae bacterium]|nr:MAG: AraC family transcriptional regulator [Flavobacteriaceae bacterium]
MHFISLNNETEVESSAGLHFSKLTPFHEFKLSKDDYVFIPGLTYELLSNTEFLRECTPFLNWLNIQFKNEANICSVCTGTFLLAEAGILNGKSCTTHWRFFTKFIEKYPEIALKKNRLFVHDASLYSSAGVCSGIDLALYILESQFDAKLAADVAKEVVIYFRRSESDPQLSIFLQYRNHLDTRIHDAQDYLMKHISDRFKMENVAEKVHMSVRNLTRLFKKTTGITLGHYLEKLRVEKAVDLLSDKHKVEFVAHQCGLKSANQLRTLLKKHKDILPTDISSLK